MEKYRRVTDPTQRLAVFPEEKYVQRINMSGKLCNYVAYAERMLQDGSIGKVEIVALGRAINRAVTVAEIVRRNNRGVHQLTSLRSVCIKDKFVPIEEGLKELEMERVSSCISILIAKTADDMDTDSPGYAAPDAEFAEQPISAETIAEMDMERSGSNQRRGRGHGANGNGRGGRQHGGRRRGGRGQRGQRGQTDRNMGNTASV